jgi:hypothetical protein
MCDIEQSASAGVTIIVQLKNCRIVGGGSNQA